MARSIIQAAAVGLIALTGAFIHNALSSNGIDPFRKISEVPVVDETMEDVSEGIRFISLEKLMKVIDAGGIIIDSRTQREYKTGHIPGAVHLDYYEFGWQMEDVIPLLDYDNEFAIYCSGPLCEDSEMLARELYTLGYRKILVFKGGMEKWEEEGLPVENGNGQEE
ncbi:MAG: rhodanese-like domain-containing protein [Candidatus Krumholzibacteriota bacterium]|nr:rhodanese-like domain-containing protein [Candidatus Krumholzibacteriota bacterium]